MLAVGLLVYKTILCITIARPQLVTGAYRVDETRSDRFARSCGISSRVAALYRAVAHASYGLLAPRLVFQPVGIHCDCAASTDGGGLSSRRDSKRSIRAKLRQPIARRGSVHSRRARVEFPARPAPCISARRVFTSRGHLAPAATKPSNGASRRGSDRAVQALVARSGHSQVRATASALRFAFSARPTRLWSRASIVGLV